ncbi:MAG: phospho-N-acetylmuramoyl-pentapeptide-transferase [Sciscionella sp.]|nr:phospho-N-acetylmuramoyl-pentapeptide-transferase [Sciscionella sp.]
MRAVLIAAAVALVVSILFTPYLIKVFSRQGFGQEIRDEAPQGHQSKRGTPTMGGVAILVALWLGYIASHLFGHQPGPSASAILVLLLATMLSVVGFIDDFIKVRRTRNLGLNKTAKLVGQLLAAVVFGILVLQFPDSHQLTPVSTKLSFVRDIPFLSLGAVGFVVFCYLAVTAWSNAVNFTDGLDGLCGGSAAMVLATYIVITFFENSHSCVTQAETGCFFVRDASDMSLVAASALGACAGFLWWNAAPAKIFMGDTGSLALGGLVAGMSMVTHTELLMIVIGGLFVVEMLSVVLQIAVFRTSGRRLFRMTPFHHHFELAGWAETSIIIRFWLLGGMCCIFGLGLFYSEWLGAAGR